MSVYLFLLTRKKVTRAQAKRIDRIVRECGGDGFVCPEGGLPGNATTGWCTGPNLGHPFDGDLRQTVLAEIERQKLGWLFE